MRDCSLSQNTGLHRKRGPCHFFFFFFFFFFFLFFSDGLESCPSNVELRARRYGCPLESAHWVDLSLNGNLCCWVVVGPVEIHWNSIIIMTTHTTDKRCDFPIALPPNHWQVRREGYLFDLREVIHMQADNVSNIRMCFVPCYWWLFSGVL